MNSLGDLSSGRRKPTPRPHDYGKGPGVDATLAQLARLRWLADPANTSPTARAYREMEAGADAVIRAAGGREATSCMGSLR